MKHPLADCWFLTGSTASGKSVLGVQLARELNGEILSLDSMAIYRHMDIGTAKPSPAEQGEIPHHLIDILDPHEEFSVAQYLALAQATVNDIRARGKTPIFVGGTPLYLKTLLRGFFEGPPADWRLREELEEEARAKSWDTLYTRLEQVDPAAAARIERNDQRRIVRALEVYELTGRPLSELQREFERETPSAELRVFILDWPRPIMHERINARVEQMIAAGLVAETEALLKLPQGLGRTALQAVGYAEIREHLSGQKSLNEAILRIQARTRQFAKRQMTWFRSLGELRWVTMEKSRGSDAILAEILGQGRAVLDDI
jgi:tRNA dimethylallyltransferase